MKRTLVPLLLALSALAGCAGPIRPREIDTLQLVETMGVDGGNGAVILSVSDSGEEPVRLAARGRSIPEAAERLQALSEREELFYAHIRFALLGEDAARAGTGEVLDWFRRSPQTRLAVPLLVVRAGDARALVAGDGESEREITGLLRSLQEDCERSGGPHHFTMLEITRQLSRSGAALCAAVRAVPPGESVPGESAPAVLADGYAVLKDGVLAGFLDPGAARGANLLLGRTGAAEYVLSGATVRLRGAKVRQEVVPGPEGAPRLTVTAEVRAGLTGRTGEGPLTEEELARMETELARRIAGETDAALKGVRDAEADVFALWEEHRDAPDREAFLRSLTWEIAVSAAVERSYDTDGGVFLEGKG